MGLLRRCGALSCLLALVFALPLAAQIKAVKLKPTSDWSVERVGDTCTISRRFGDRARPTTLTLRNRDPWNGGFHVGITSEKYALTGEPPRAGWLPNGRFVTGREARVVGGKSDTPTLLFRHGLWDTMPKKGTREYKAYWAKDEAGDSIGPRKFKREVNSFFVNHAFERPLLLATGAMDEVFDRRDACMDDVLIAMGIDPKDEDRDDHLVEMTNAMQLGRFLARKAPKSIRIPGDWGLTSFLLYLNAETSITSCRLSTLPYDADFEVMGCRELKKRAKFRFKDGEKPRASFFKLAFRN